jgi:hypothetical protein
MMFIKTMIDSREKGKKIERLVATTLRPFFPRVARNANAQSQGSNGLDLIETGCFDFEVKGGDSYKSGFYTHVQKWLDQVVAAGSKAHYKVVWFRPDRPLKMKRENDPKSDREFVMMPADDFKALLKLLKTEKII